MIERTINGESPLHFSNDIWVVLILREMTGWEVTLKRVRRGKAEGFLVLCPTNPDFEEEEVSADPDKIKFCGIMKGTGEAPMIDAQNDARDLDAALALWDSEAQSVNQLLARTRALSIEIDMMPLQGAAETQIELARDYWLQCEWRALFRQHAFWFSSAQQEQTLRATRAWWPWFGALEFERLCRAALSLSHEQLWELTPATGDGGFDLVHRETLESESAVVEALSLAQCKLYRAPLGVSETREFCGAMSVRGASCGFCFAPPN